MFIIMVLRVLFVLSIPIIVKHRLHVCLGGAGHGEVQGLGVAQVGGLRGERARRRGG